MTNDTKRNALTLCLIGLVVSLFFAFNRVVPFFGDDLRFAFFNDKPLSSLFGCWQAATSPSSLLRVWCVFLSSAFASLWGELSFDVVNTLAFLGVLVVFWRFVMPRGMAFGRSLLGWGVFLVAFFSLSTSKDCLFYWAAGGCFYIIPLVFVGVEVALFLFVYRRRSLNSPLLAVVLLVVSFLLSLHHEMYIAALLGVFLYSAAKSIKLRRGESEFLRRKILWAFFFGTLFAMLVIVFWGDFFQRATLHGSGMTAFLSNTVRTLLDIRAGYVLLVILGASYLRNRRLTRAFLKANDLWLIALFCGFIAAWTGGTGGRSLFLMEVVSAVLLVRWVYFFGLDTLKYGVALGSLLVVAFFMVEVCFFVDYKRKWQIVDAAAEEYLSAKENVVIFSDYKGISSPWTLSLPVFLTEYWNTAGWTLQKEMRLGAAVKKPLFLPRSVFGAIKSGKAYAADRLVQGNGRFFKVPDTPYYVARYDEALAKGILSGRLSVRNEMKFLGKRLFVNFCFLPEQLLLRNQTSIVHSPKYGDFIVFSNVETRVPLFSVSQIYIAEKHEARQWMTLGAR